MDVHTISPIAAVLLWAMLVFVCGLNLASAQQMFVGNFGQILGWILLAVLLIPYAIVILYMMWKPAMVGPDPLLGLANKLEVNGQIQATHNSNNSFQNLQVRLT